MNFFQKNSGQIFSSDFLIGIIVLLFICTALQVYHSNMIQRIEHQNKLLYHESLLSRTDTFILSEGIPTNWNRSNVEVLGFSTGEPNHLNETKIQNFLNLNESMASKLLGTRGYDFYFDISLSNGSIIKRSKEPIAYFAQELVDTGILQRLNNSGFVWDLYWGGSVADLPPSTAREVYQNDDEVALFKGMISNLTLYHFLVSEDPEVSQGDLSPEEEEELRDWISQGNRWFHLKQQEDLVSIIGPTPQSTATQGIVKNLDPILPNGSVGENYTFEDGADYFNSSEEPGAKIIINASEQKPNSCILCKWDYGGGTIYYLIDSLLQGGEFFSELSVKNVVKRPFQKGEKDWGDAENVYTVERKVFLEGSNQKAVLRLVVWRE